MNGPRTLDNMGVFASLRNACAEAGGQSEWARIHGVSPSMVCDVMAGRRNPGDAMLRALGLQKITRYVPTRDGRVGNQMPSDGAQR